MAKVIRATPAQLVKAAIQNREAFAKYGFCYMKVVRALLATRLKYIVWEEIGLESGKNGLPADFVIDKS